jgi:xanthine dehydrogenase accessory factor
VNVLVEAGRLAEEGVAFALATVVGVERPASARIGDRALVTAEGELRGWVGGACTEPEVVRLALHALAGGDVRRERIESRCASEGAVEVLIEPQRPPPLLAVIGDSPAARTLRELAAVLKWRTTTQVERADAVVVAAMGRGDEEALEAALASGAGYVGLIASARRAAAVTRGLRERGVDEDALAPVRSPAGLDLGPSAQEEIAVAILAELVAWRHTRGPSPAEVTVETAVDPICGMNVTIADAAHVLEHEGTTYYFCCAGCLRRFEAALVR